MPLTSCRSASGTLHAKLDRHKTSNFCNKCAWSVVYVQFHSSAHERSASSWHWRVILRDSAAPCATPCTPMGVCVELSSIMGRETRGTAQVLGWGWQCFVNNFIFIRIIPAAAISSSTLVFKLELESWEQTLEDQPDDISSKQPPKYNKDSAMGKCPQLIRSSIAWPHTGHGMQALWIKGPYKSRVWRKIRFKAEESYSYRKGKFSLHEVWTSFCRVKVICKKYQRRHATTMCNTAFNSAA